MEETQHKAYKFRLQPTEEQKVLLSKHFGCARFVYNHFLEERQERYLNNKKTLNYHSCCAALTQLRQLEEYIWLQEVNTQCLQASLKNLETAYHRFFKKTSGFPSFKKRSNTNSFTCPQRVTLKDPKHIQITKFKEGIRFINHREIKGKICSATISRTPTGRHYVSIHCESPKQKPLPKTRKSVGVDLGIKDFIVTSEGQKYSNPHFLRAFEAKLNKQKQNFNRKQKDSKRKERARIKAARTSEKITNSRENMQHQVSSSLVKQYDLIALEDLNVKGMMKNHLLAKAISDVSWSSFVSKLKYKAEWYGKEVIVIERFFPSSKTCNNCHHIKESLDLSERSWVCPECEAVHDRDVNAAKNILQRALTIKSSGTDDYRHRAVVRPEVTKVAKGTGVEVSKKRRVYSLKPSA